MKRKENPNVLDTQKFLKENHSSTKQPGYQECEQKPIIEFVLEPKLEAAVAQYAWISDANLNQENEEDFISRERRKFYLRVKDVNAADANLKTVKVQWGTLRDDNQMAVEDGKEPDLNKDDYPSGVELTLTRVRGTSVYLSQALLLVTGKNDVNPNSSRLRRVSVYNPLTSKAHAEYDYDPVKPAETTTINVRKLSWLKLRVMHKTTGMYQAVKDAQLKVEWPEDGSLKSFKTDLNGGEVIAYVQDILVESTATCKIKSLELPEEETKPGLYEVVEVTTQ